MTNPEAGGRRSGEGGRNLRGGLISMGGLSRFSDLGLNEDNQQAGGITGEENLQENMQMRPRV